MRQCKFLIILVSVLLTTFMMYCFSVRSEAASSGSYGANTWTLDDNGLLTISGSHEMRDYGSTGSRPWYDSEVKAVVINRGVTTVGNKAFSNCNNLTSVVIADSVVRIGKNAFSNCTSLKSITIPDSVEIVDASVFDGCVNLTSVTIGNKVKSVGDGAFARCSSLTNITFPDSVESLGERVFSNCSGLTTITIPDGIADIGSRMFDQCGNLKTVVLPASVTDIGELAFRECYNLTHVFYQGTRDQWENITIAETAALTADVHCGVTIGSCLKDAIHCTECDCCYLQDGTAKEHGEIVFKNWDGKTIQRKVYHKGDTIKKPSAPTRPADSTYTYTFAGWDREVVACAGDATYTATYTPTYIDYTVTFVNEDGTELSQKTYHWGDEVTVPAEPAKAADNTYTYAFAGWDKEVVACAGDATYTATYTPTYIDYTVTFVNEDGTELSQKTYHWGDEVTVPAEPTKAADNTYTYAFAGWDKEVVACAGDATYTATYTPTYIDYTIAFQRDDGSLISKATYHYGDRIQIPEDLSKAADNTYSYTFSAWDKEISDICNGDAVYTASYTPTYIDYVVEFRYWNGAIVSRETYHYGDTVIVPADILRPADEVFAYTFIGWDNEVTPCQGNKIYTAVYVGTYIDYTVTFQYEDGTVISSKTYHYGDSVEIPADPVKESDSKGTYTFVGWDKEITACVENAVYTAVFSCEEHLPDYDGNGVITDADAVYLLRHTLFPEEYPLNGNGDVNSDGEVTDADAVYLLRHTLFPEEYPLRPGKQD